VRCTIIGFIITFALGCLFVAPLAAEAQPPTKVYRIGRLLPGSPPPEPYAPMVAFHQALREFGYVEGQNLVIESRYAEGSPERLRDLAAELIRLQMDVIVATGGAIRAAKEATSTIPIVMTGATDPVGAGYVASLARPGGNITGVSLQIVELPGKRLELLKETVPQSTRVAVLANPDNPVYASLRNNLTVAARALGLYLHVVEVHSADELAPAFAAVTREGADALMVLADPALMDNLRGQVTDLAATHRLPAMYTWKMYVEAGGLMSYGPSLPDLYRRVAYYVDRILKGAKPADLPVEQPTKFELVMNLKTAQALGITIPPHLLLLADEVLK
jgi:ABC-type uncharacterized transport system substrate-binding protein